MPECHTCSLNSGSKKILGKPGPYCKTCKGPSDGPNNHGKNHVSVEQVASFIPAPVPVAIQTEWDAALHMLHTMGNYGIIEREIIFQRLQGKEYPAITAWINLYLVKKITIQGVHARVKKVVGRNPQLAELFKGMVTKQLKRKKKGQTEA